MNAKVPCLLLLNDTHIARDNISEFLLNWNEALSVCEEYGIKNIAVGGDLFYSRASQTLDILLTVHDCFLLAERQGINVFVANGNHDKVDQEAIRGYCHVFDQHENVIVANDFFTITEMEWNFELHLIPYFPENGSFQEVLNHVISNCLSATKRNYLYIHEGINGALAQPSEKELPTGIFKAFDKVFVGHYHNRCSIEGTNIEYIGSSRQHNFGEDTKKGYTILFTDGSDSFIQNKVNTKYEVFEIPFEKITLSLLDRLKEIQAEGRTKVKVKIHCTTEQAPSVNKQDFLDCGVSKIEVITDDITVKNTSNTSLYEKFSKKIIVQTYEEFCKTKSLEDIQLGLSYLSKIE